MNREEFRELCPAFVAGDLEGETLHRFQEYLRDADTEDAEYLAHLMGVSIEPAVRKSRERTDERAVVSPRRPWLPIGMTVVSIVMVVGFSMFVSNLMSTIDRQNTTVDSLKQQSAESAAQLVELRTELDRKTEMLDILGARHVAVAFMSGQPVHPSGYGKIVWDPENRNAMLQVSNLPPVPEDRDYQLWILKESDTISAGVFSVEDTLQAFFAIGRLVVSDPDEIRAFTITLEPEGGGPTPTGTVYLAGSPREDL
ncbi:MAG: anti-sigma factor [Ignavibacteria bacterium]|nr:anti-sigma factor [Ignavibacteria bacterium]